MQNKVISNNKKDKEKITKIQVTKYEQETY